MGPRAGVRSPCLWFATAALLVVLLAQACSGARSSCSPADTASLVADLERDACTHATVRSTVTLASLDDARRIAEALRRSQKLTSIVFSGVRFGDEQLGLIADGLAAPTSRVSSLVFWDNGFGSKGLEGLLRALKAPSSAVSTLHISDIRLGDEGAGILASFLPTAQLTALVLTDTGIGPQGAKKLAAALKSNQRLTRFVISGVEEGEDGNDIGDEGARAFARALVSKEVAGTSVLTQLVLSGTKITDEGAKELADAIAESKIVNQIVLHKNAISDNGARALAAALEKNTSLRLLVLTENKITDDGAFAIAEALMKNEHITTVDCDRNPRMTATGHQAIKAGLSKSQLPSRIRDEL